MSTETFTAPDQARKEMRDFLKKHRACSEGEKWALENCKSLSQVWTDAKPDWLIWVATRDGVLSDSDLRLFTCWSVRRVWHLLTDPRSRNAVEVSERYARGQATQDELRAAWAAAWAAQAAYLRSAYKNPFITKGTP